MTSNAIERFYSLGGRPALDRWLRFAPPLQADYDETHAAARTVELRSAILAGLALFNVYNLTGLVLIPDILELSIALRVGVVTPASLALVWLIGRTTPLWTERFVLAGVTNAYIIPVFIFWLTQEPNGIVIFGELFLIVAFANMVLALRFAHAIAFTGTALGVTLLAVFTKTGLDPALIFAFTVEIITACAFGLYANYRIERHRCTDYLSTLEAHLAARIAEAESRAYQDLSRTDVLTKLPNRRFLAERLEEWVSVSRSTVLMMIDIDHFKLYNDTLGHPAGDDCLQRIASTFAAIAEKDDGAFCARYGGEEFTFVLRDASEIEAARCARNLVQSVRALEIDHPARPDGTGLVTISVGVFRSVAGTSLSVPDLFAAGDRALYTAKRRGRDRFVLNDQNSDIDLGSGQVPGAS